MVERLRNRARDAEAAAVETPAPPVDAKAANWARVQLARNLRRPRTLELLGVMADEFVELHGDRRVRRRRGDRRRASPRSAATGSRSSASRRAPTPRRTCAAASACPTPRATARRCGSWSSPSGAACPVVTFVDVPGAHPGPESEERGIAEAIARSIGLMTRLRTPIVTVITGEGGSGGALAIAVGDVVLALENAVYSVISPEGCASILWRTSDEAPTAALAMKMSVIDQQALGVVDEVISEPPEGAHTDHEETGRRLKAVLVRELERLEAIPLDVLVDMRYRRYRSLGAFAELEGPAPTPAVPPRPGLADRLRGLFEAGQRAIPAPPLPVGRRDEPPAREDV